VGGIPLKIIDEARQHPEVDALYREVDAVTAITVTIVSGASWSSLTNGGATQIEAGTAKSPAAALYHELLHARLKIAGYKQHDQIVPTRARIFDLKPLVEALDNELQHHRMFGAFAAAGFSASAFYSDDDASAFTMTRRELRKMSPKDPLEHFFLKLLTVIAPGGHGSDDDRRKLRNFLRVTAGPKKATSLDLIEGHIKAWTASTSLDPGPTLRAVLQEIGDADGGWLGASQNFPTDGIFTGAPFDIDAAEAFIAALR
jgi:hypothetical protein